MNPVFLYIVGTIMALAALVSTVFLIRILIQMRPLMARLDSAAQFLEAERPKVVRILADLEVQVGEMRGITESAHRMVGSAESVSSGVRAAAQPFIAEVQDLSMVLRHVRAVAVAVTTGVSAWRAHRESPDTESTTPLETDNES